VDFLPDSGDNAGQEEAMKKVAGLKAKLTKTALDRIVMIRATPPS
jgi:hypothetical protein